jgi:hypothetical protein
MSDGAADIAVTDLAVALLKLVGNQQQVSPAIFVLYLPGRSADRAQLRIRKG